MNNIIHNIQSPELTMSSQDVAQLVKKRHDNVKRTIELLADRGVIQRPQIEEVKNYRGQRVSGFQIGKRDSFVIVAQLSPEFTARLVDRWQELECRINEPAWLSNLSPQAKVALEDLNSQMIELSHKVDQLENLFTEGMTPTQFCKGLNGVNVMAISQVLADRKWLFREGGHWRVGSYARDQYLTEQQTQITPRDADPFVQFKPVLLQKGAAKLYALYLKRELIMKRGWDGTFTHNKLYGQVA